MHFSSKQLQMVDAMAANSGGIEWSAVLKPFLSYRKDNANQSELIELCSTIVKRYVLKYFQDELTFQCHFGEIFLSPRLSSTLEFFLQRI